MKKSPSGSLCPYYYMGGELHPLKYGSYFKDKNKLFEVINAEEEFILRSPGSNNRRIWMDLYETKLDDEVINRLVHHIIAISRKINKICLVGCKNTDYIKIKTGMIKSHPDLAGQIKLFSDPENAKQWLISELS